MYIYNVIYEFTTRNYCAIHRSEVSGGTLVSPISFLNTACCDALYVLTLLDRAIDSISFFSHAKPHPPQH